MRFNVRTLRTTDLHRPSLWSAGSASFVNSFLVSSWSQVRLNQTWSSLWKFWSGEEQEAGERLMIHPSPVRCAFKHPSHWRSKKLRHVIRTGLHWLTGDICLFRCFFFCKLLKNWDLPDSLRASNSLRTDSSLKEEEFSLNPEDVGFLLWAERHWPSLIKISFTKMEEEDVIKNQRCSKLKPEE